MSNPTEFLHALAQEDLKGPERWSALVWWYFNQGRALEATPRQICQDMESAGYGKQNTTRVSEALGKDRRLTKGKQNSFGVRITAKAELDAKYLPLLGNRSTLSPTDELKAKPQTVKTPKTDGKASQANGTAKTSKVKPTLFIGSSAEGLKQARALEKQLEHHAEVTIWKDGVFGLGGGTLETLVNDLPKYDFAALVLTADDLAESRGKSQPAPRDNVIFELGLFMGRLGRFRTFIVYNKDASMKLPSDLAGVTPATFRDREDGNYHAQMSPPSTLIIDAIEKHGRFSGHT